MEQRNHSDAALFLSKIKILLLGYLLLTVCATSILNEIFLDFLLSAFLTNMNWPLIAYSQSSLPSGRGYTVSITQFLMKKMSLLHVPRWNKIMETEHPFFPLLWHLIFIILKAIDCANVVEKCCYSSYDEDMSEFDLKKIPPKLYVIAEYSVFNLI